MYSAGKYILQVKRPTHLHAVIYEIVRENKGSYF